MYCILCVVVASLQKKNVKISLTLHETYICLFDVKLFLELIIIYFKENFKKKLLFTIDNLV